jgi:hypothetical protein
MFFSCVYIFCGPVSLEAFASCRSLIQRRSTKCLIRFRTPKTASENIDSVLNRKSAKTYVHFVKENLMMTSLVETCSSTDEPVIGDSDMIKYGEIT